MPSFEPLVTFQAEIPYPLSFNSFPIQIYQEPLLEDFKGFRLSRALNIAIGILGFLLASILLFRLKNTKIFKRDGLVKSLLESCIVVLSFFNALYSGTLSAVLIYDLVYMKMNHLLRPYSLGEVYSDAFMRLQESLQVYTLCVFSVRQLAWPCMYFHLYISYMFLMTTTGRRPVSGLQHNFFWAIFAVVMLSAISTTLETLSYKEYLPLEPLTIEVLLSLPCLCLVAFAYTGTAIALRGPTKGHVLGPMSPKFLHVRNVAILKLLAVLLAFILVWAFVIGNNLNAITEGESVAVDVSISTL